MHASGVSNAPVRSRSGRLLKIKISITDPDNVHPCGGVRGEGDEGFHPRGPKEDAGESRTQGTGQCLPHRISIPAYAIEQQ
jgi:hypothetical protein